MFNGKQMDIVKLFNNQGNDESSKLASKGVFYLIYRQALKRRNIFSLGNAQWNKKRSEQCSTINIRWEANEQYL